MPAFSHTIYPLVTGNKRLYDLKISQSLIFHQILANIIDSMYHMHVILFFTVMRYRYRFRLKKVILNNILLSKHFTIYISKMEKFYSPRHLTFYRVYSHYAPSHYAPLPLRPLPLRPPPITSPVLILSHYIPSLNFVPLHLLLRFCPITPPT